MSTGRSAESGSVPVLSGGLALGTYASHASGMHGKVPCIPRQQGQQRLLIYASRSSREGCRECVHKVDNSPEGQSSENNASGRRRDRTSSSLPSWAVCGPMMDRARGARGPLTLRLAGTPERRIERNTNNRQAILFYWWVPTDRPNLRLGSRKGTYCPKWEV